MHLSSVHSLCKMDFPSWPEAKGTAHWLGEKSASLLRNWWTDTLLIFWLLTKQARWMPKFNKITHYCVIGAVLQESRNSEELHIGSPPPPPFVFWAFLKSIVTWGGGFCRKMAKWNLESRDFSNKPEGSNWKKTRAYNYVHELFPDRTHSSLTSQSYI